MINKIIIYIPLSFFILFFFSKLSYQFKLLDLPNKRKIHSKPTAYTGGISISIILLVSLELFDISNIYLNIILSIGFLTAIVGFIDDRFNLNVGGKLSLQIIPIFYLIIYENLLLNQIGDYNYFKIELGSFVIPFTLLSVLFLNNAFNYFDGIDGCLSVAFISVILILYFLVQDLEFRFFLIIITIPVFLFLLFNFSFFKLPKLFLGDSGSLFLGFITSFILIYLSKNNIVHPILLAWSIAIFVYEFLSINIIRLKENKNFFQAGLDHLHNIIFERTKSIFLTNIYIFIINTFLFLIGYFSFILISSFVSLLLFIFLFFIYLIIRLKLNS